MQKKHWKNIYRSLMGDLPRPASVIAETELSCNYSIPCVVAVIALLIGLFVNSLLPTPKHPIPLLLKAILPFLGFAFPACLLSLLILSQKLGRKTTFHIPEPPQPFQTLLEECSRMLLLIYPLSLLLTGLSTLFLKFLRISTPPQFIALLAKQPLSFSAWCFLFLSTVILAPVYEEVLFRIVFFRTFYAQNHRHAAWITSLLFAAIHATPQAFPSLFFLAVCLQRARAQGGLPKAILLHSLFNLCSFLLLLFHNLFSHMTP